MSEKNFESKPGAFTFNGMLLSQESRLSKKDKPFHIVKILIGSDVFEFFAFEKFELNDRSDVTGSCDIRNNGGKVSFSLKELM